MKSWLPWRWLLRHAARRTGFIDPFAFLARLRKLAQPSEVQEPIELIRAGAVFHARGLINTKVLQNNLDWVWPYWVVRQFDPEDPSFLPRAFSFSHVNLTHRNWTALGLPGMSAYPIVDPRGMVTPLTEGWSLDWWFVPEDGQPLYPSCAGEVEQSLQLDGSLDVTTIIRRSDAELILTASVVAPTQVEAPPELVASATLRTSCGGELVLAVRPTNPEGIRFIDQIRVESCALLVDHDPAVRLHPAPARFATSHYALGDVAGRLDREANIGSSVHCPAGLATAAAVFPVTADGETRAEVRVLLPASVPSPSVSESLRWRPAPVRPRVRAWPEKLERVPRVHIPDARWAFLHEAAVHTLLLLAPHDIYPGPSTYRRFWFRDACLIMNSMLALNLREEVCRAIARFPLRQRTDGYFHSQEGEWDSNGEVLWIADRIERTMGALLPASLMRALERGGNWIVRKRNPQTEGRQAGLLPPGFSAEHLGPNDFYYWDNFWGLAGLQGLAAMCERRNAVAAARRFRAEAAAFLAAIRASLESLPSEIAGLGIPASPFRRMDAGAIGSMVADYPLQLDAIGRARLERTADWLWRHCRFNGGFFQDMIHSGINAYLSLALAQSFLRFGDERHLGLMQSVADLASSTGQWPEAVHPRTGGGCMGDGQHAWAAAEWILMLRALFVREEPDHLVIGSGLPASWFDESDALAYGPTGTAWGAVQTDFLRHREGWRVRLTGEWHGQPPRIRVAVTGFEPVWLPPRTNELLLSPAPPAKDRRSSPASRGPSQPA